MKLFRISQNVNNGFDTYDSAIVAARDVEDAVLVHPCNGWKYEWCDQTEKWVRSGAAKLSQCDRGISVWCKPEDVLVEYIGIAKASLKRGIILASFNAG